MNLLLIAFHCGDEKRTGKEGCTHIAHLAFRDCVVLHAEGRPFRSAVSVFNGCHSLSRHLQQLVGSLQIGGLVRLNTKLNPFNVAESFRESASAVAEASSALIMREI